MTTVNVNIPEIDAAIVRDLVNSWLRLHPDVASNPEARNYIQQFSSIHYQQAGTLPTAELFDRGLAAYWNAKTLATDRQKLGEALVHWFQNPTILYFAQSDSNWARARAWLGAQKEVILKLEDWVQCILKSEFDGQWDWSISTDQLVPLIRSAKSPYLEFGRVNGHLRLVSGLLIDKFGKEAVEAAYERFSGGVKKTAEGRYSAHTTDEWRANEDKKAAEAEARRHADPKLIERARRETVNIVYIYRDGGNHAATARGRQQLQSVIDAGLASGKSWFQIYDEVQAEANRLARL